VWLLVVTSRKKEVSEHPSTDRGIDGLKIASKPRKEWLLFPHKLC
jgi:hypothetical protein